MRKNNVLSCNIELLFIKKAYLCLLSRCLGLLFTMLEKNDEFWLLNECGDLNIAAVAIITRNFYIIVENVRAERSILG